MKVNHEELVGHLEPSSQTETPGRIEITWLLDDRLYIVKTIDKDTGLIHWRKKQRQAARTPSRRQKVDDYYMVFNAIGKAREDRALTYDEAALLHSLVERIEWEDNFVYNRQGDRMSAWQLAEYIGKDYGWTLRTLKLLAVKGFIRLDINRHGSSIFVEPRYAWRGHIKQKPMKLEEIKQKKNK